MLKLNLKNAVTDEAVAKYAPTVKSIAENMEKLNTVGFEFLGWKDQVQVYDKVEFAEIQKEAKRLKSEGVDLLVVIGIGGSYAGPKAAIEMILGEYPTKREMEIVYVGESISSTNLAQKLAYVQHRRFAINVISKSGTTTEPAVAFRLFKKLLEDKVGVNNASKFIVATTDANRGALNKIATENGYKKFVIPDNIGGRFSVLTAVGLFPMACAGVDISKVMKGATEAHAKYSSTNLLENDAYRYAVARFILNKQFSVEMMVQYEGQMKMFNEWWKQLAGESEGKNEKGIFPASAVFSTDLHSLGQFIQEGTKMLWETVLTVETPNLDVNVIRDEKNLDELNYLTSKTVHQINTVAFEATTDAHVKVGRVPNIHIQMEKMNEETFGALTQFFFRAVAMTGYLMGVNPFNQPGVEVYKQNMFKQLGKP